MAKVEEQRLKLDGVSQPTPEARETVIKKTDFEVELRSFD